MCDHCDALNKVLTDVLGGKVAALISKRVGDELHRQGLKNEKIDVFGQARPAGSELDTVPSQKRRFKLWSPVVQEGRLSEALSRMKG